MEDLALLIIAFVGYAVGRVSHIMGGHLNIPDHWIYGVLAIIIDVVFYKHTWAQLLIAFGVGHTISDLKDMINLKFYGPDEVEVKEFWGID